MSMLMNNCRKLTSIGTQLLRSSAVASQILVRHKSYESKRFPGYHVVYSLEPIKTLSIINNFKRNSSIIAGIIVPGVYLLALTDVMAIEVSNGIAFAGLSFPTFLHAVGYFCNNVVGYIYAKKDTKDLMISYVDFWGKRVDIQTTADDASYIEPNNKYYTPIFSGLNVRFPKVSLKIYQHGKITDADEFYKLFGVLL